ncbi:MAG: acyltransferase family protein [Candidatus Cloacimonadia bacterium]
MKTISDVYKKSNNFFYSIRFILATLVIYSHSPMLLDRSKDIIAEFTGISLGFVSVKAFFVISGFFITQSFTSSKTIWIYFLKRFLRIMPPLFITLFVMAFILGPLLSNLCLRDYFFSTDSGSPFLYFINYLSFDLTGSSYDTYFIRDIFCNNPSKVVNGSLWSLKFEFIMYTILPGIFLLFWLVRKRIIFLLILIVLSFLEFKQIHTGNFVGKIGHAYYISLIVDCGYYFFSGVILYTFKDKIFMGLSILLVSIVCFISFTYIGYFNFALMFFLPYIIIICLGILFKKDPLKRMGDFSYGIYVYAYPVQQIIIQFYKVDLTVFKLFYLSFIMTLIVSILSWHFLEKPSINLLRNNHFERNLLKLAN